jgi:hypothetical protein
MSTFYQGKIYGLANIKYSTRISKDLNAFEGIGVFTDG